MKIFSKLVTRLLSAAFVVGLFSSVPMPVRAEEGVTVTPIMLCEDKSHSNKIDFGELTQYHYSSRLTGEEFVAGVNARIEQMRPECTSYTVYIDEACTQVFNGENLAGRFLYVDFNCGNCERAEYYKARLEEFEERFGSGEDTEENTEENTEEDIEEDTVESVPAYVPTAEEIAEQQRAAFEARQKKVVTFANGEQIKTEIDGVYEVASLDGTAVTTSKLDVQKAVGLTDEQIASGTNVSMFMGNLYDKATRETLENAIAAVGKTPLAMFYSDMYTITKEGQITKVNSTENEITVVFGIPGNAIDVNRTFSIFCLTPDGNVVEMEDVDTDPYTISIKAKYFGKCVVAY